MRRRAQDARALAVRTFVAGEGAPADVRVVRRERWLEEARRRAWSDVRRRAGLEPERQDVVDLASLRWEGARDARVEALERELASARRRGDELLELLLEGGRGGGAPGPLGAVVRRRALAALDRAGGSKTRAAAELGVSRRTVYNWLARWAAGGGRAPRNWLARGATGGQTP